MKSRLLLATGIILTLIFGALAAFNGSYLSTHKGVAAKEVVVALQDSD